MEKIEDNQIPVYSVWILDLRKTPSEKYVNYGISLNSEFLKNCKKFLKKISAITPKKSAQIVCARNRLCYYLRFANQAFLPKKNPMKKALIALSFVAAFSGLATAGDKGYVVDKNPVPPAPAPCYSAGYEFGIFGAGFIPNGDSSYDDSIGGGVSFGYFFNENLGIDASAAWYSTDSVMHNYTVDLVYRLPMDCIAPYILGGGGVHTNSHTEGLARLGGGVDFRFTPTTSFFADGAYNWVNGDIENYTTVRAGLRFAF